uniref:Uncharacterized protein n=1 Tax=uncultured marine virus TaxID=186617 RepID=A0A0F7L6V7_9VIRU|nr:hypothetical protein [uncultured marine virus]
MYVLCSFYQTLQVLESFGNAIILVKSHCIKLFQLQHLVACTVLAHDLCHACHAKQV